MLEAFKRSAILLGEEGLKKLSLSRVAVFGVGGVGGYCVEALARAGVGEIHLIDNDKVSESNLNRQITALKSTVGRYKTEVMKGRIADINPACKVVCRNIFFLAEDREIEDFSIFDYVVDAIDTVSGKIEIVSRAAAAGVPVISCMGAGNKLDPTAFKVGYIEKTCGCPLARVMRRELKKRNIKGVKAVYSEETPLKSEGVEKTESGKVVPGSVSFVPAVAGLIAAGEVIKHIAGKSDG